jgi:DNA processing protein
MSNESNRKLLTEDRDALMRAHDSVYEEIQNTWDIGAKVVTMFDRDYPQRLVGIKDQPIVVYYSDDLSVLDTAVACVGTREPTEFGAVAAEQITGALAEEG